MVKSWRKFVGACTLLMAVPMIFAGCGANKQQAAGAVQVKTMAAIQQNTPLSFEYAGTVKGTNEVSVQSRVSGSVVAKYIHGGEQVTAGQALYKVDDGNYINSLNQAKANLAQAQATLSNAQQDLSRYAQLVNNNAISEQTYTNQQQTVASYQAAVEADEALVDTAKKNYNDTIVRAPISGRLDVNDVATGTYATGGSTTLVTLGAVDPVYVQFSLSENEYLKFNQVFNGQFIGTAVNIVLSDGSKYPIAGKVAQVDRSMTDNTGTLTVKAVFDNPNTLLLPGMFARVELTGETVPNAILVPQRAVQQVLDKSFVMVVGADNKTISRAVKLGEKIGSYQIIESGIKAGDKVIVEGLTKVRDGVLVNPTMTTAKELGLTMQNSADIKDASSAGASQKQ
ncbi:efflux RND transporter periplasmic adaptor subunit [Pectinatus brassicae]|nr:efflux RND transporter periplasmic adaptor subunit [Pectinatus brassicae]